MYDNIFCPYCKDCHTPSFTSDDRYVTCNSCGKTLTQNDFDAGKQLFLEVKWNITMPEKLRLEK